VPVDGKVACKGVLARNKALPMIGEESATEATALLDLMLPI